MPKPTLELLRNSAKSRSVCDDRFTIASNRLSSQKNSTQTIQNLAPPPLWRQDLLQNPNTRSFSAFDPAQCSANGRSPSIGCKRPEAHCAAQTELFDGLLVLGTSIDCKTSPTRPLQGKWDAKRNLLKQRLRCVPTPAEVRQFWRETAGFLRLLYGRSWGSI